MYSNTGMAWKHHLSPLIAALKLNSPHHDNFASTGFANTGSTETSSAASGGKAVNLKNIQFQWAQRFHIASSFVVYPLKLKRDSSITNYLRPRDTS